MSPLPTDKRIYYREQRAGCLWAAIVGAALARRALSLADRIAWEEHALQALRRWRGWTELVESGDLGRVYGQDVDRVV